LDIMDMEVGAEPSARKNNTVTEAAVGIAKAIAVSTDTGCCATAQTANRQASPSLGVQSACGPWMWLRERQAVCRTRKDFAPCVTGTAP